jgi:peptidoglycan lytic transglycosylase
MVRTVWPMRTQVPRRKDRAATGGGYRGLPPALVGVIVLCLLLAWAPSAPAATLSPEDGKKTAAIFKAIDKKQWKSARQKAAKVADPLVKKIVTWLDLVRPDSRAGFDSISRFMAENPDWPQTRQLHERAEAKLPVGMDAQEVLAWFDKHPPISTEGRVRHAAALLASGKEIDGRAAVRDIWITGDFTKAQERIFYKRYRKFLSRDDHRARLERLIWDERYWPARRMLWKVDAGSRALGEARLMLMRRIGGVDKAIEKIPPQLKDHPGLTYERLRWRRRKGRHESARELLMDAPPDPVHADKWWIERAVLARSALEEGLISEAYEISKNHGMTADEDGAASFADAEWLAGWIALRFLDDRSVAMDHFVAMYQAVKYPISRARGAYWSGRAAEALKIPRLAKLWYGIAGRLTTTYYGQLAALRAGPDAGVKMPKDPKPTEEELGLFAEHELVRVVRILHQAKAEKHLRPFVSAIADVSDTPGWQAMTAGLAAVAGRPDLAIRMAKQAARNGHMLIKAGYPTIRLPELSKGVATIEAPLALAVIRQESAFWEGAISSAGARGLMQLMPATAKHQAKDMGLKYSKDRLIRDPSFNLRLGQAYLSGMVDNFDGSYVLALAGYNAGPARVGRWIREFGDPRNPSVDVIDWIESVPFKETRNYIQRVMENLQVYRARVNGAQVALALDKDLER